MVYPRLRLMPDSPAHLDPVTRSTVEYLQMLFDEAPAACVITNAACTVIDANRAAESLLLQPLSGMVDKPFRKMVASSDRQMFEKIAADILVFRFETSRPLCMKPMTGSEVDVLFKARMIKSAEGDPEFISWVFLESLSSGPRDFL